MEQKYRSKYKPLDLEFSEKKDFTIIDCPKCSCEIPSANIDLVGKLAKCDSCNAVFTIENKILELQAQSVSEEIPKPTGIDILEYNDQIELTLNQKLPQVYLIAAVFAPLLALMFLGGYAKEGYMILAYLSMAFAFAFVYALINLIRYKRNKIYVTLTQEALSIEYRPKNFVNDKFYDAKNIDQLFVKKDISGICLTMILNEPDGQKKQKLIGGFTDITKAKYVEQEIERYLGIKNKKVLGEEI